MYMVYSLAIIYVFYVCMSKVTQVNYVTHG